MGSPPRISSWRSLICSFFSSSSFLPIVVVIVYWKAYLALFLLLRPTLFSRAQNPLLLPFQTPTTQANIVTTLLTRIKAWKLRNQWTVLFLCLILYTSREAGTLDEPLRTSGWEATSTRILSESKIFGFFYQLFNDFRVSFFTFYYRDISIILLKKLKSPKNFGRKTKYPRQFPNTTRPNKKGS